MTFRVGEKVVCIGGFDASDHRLAAAYNFTVPVKNSIYTIASFVDERYIELLEILRIPFAEGGPAFDRSRFRPLIDRKSETSFTHGADPSSDQFDNRRVKVGALT